MKSLASLHVTVDRDGKPSSVVENLSPALRVVVDTTPPVIHSEISNVDGTAILRISVEDANIDPQSLRVVAELESGDQPLLHRPGRLEYPLSPHHLPSPIRISIADLAGNVTIKTIPSKWRS